MASGSGLGGGDTRVSGAAGAEQFSPLGRMACLGGQLGGWRAVAIQDGLCAGELGRGRHERRVERHRLLVEHDRAPQAGWIDRRQILRTEFGNNSLKIRRAPKTGAGQA